MSFAYLKVIFAILNSTDIFR